MQIQYHLSNRQEKELARGTQLRIALPVPLDDEYDPLAFARTCFVPRIAAMVTDAWETEVRTVPFSDPHLHFLGRIVPDDYRGKPLFTVQIAVVVSEIVPRNVRHHRSDVQWPQRVDFGRQTFPQPPANRGD